MKRVNFLRMIGLGGLVSALPISNVKAVEEVVTNEIGSCEIAPVEAFGPFPSLPKGDAMYWRQDITDGQEGIPFTFTIQINKGDGCQPLEGFRVDVWHCNADAYYSHFAISGINIGNVPGVNTPENNSDLIYNRGSQVTDADGRVTFKSIFPGWYPGRTVHIHYAVYAPVSSLTNDSDIAARSSNIWYEDTVSQFTFPIEAKNQLLQSHLPYSNYGPDPLSPDDDGLFSNPAGEWKNTQLATLEQLQDGSYYSFYETAVPGTAGEITFPIDLIGFNGSVNNQNGLLWWQTENELNFSHFELEISEDADDFEYLDTIPSKGSSDTPNHYSYEDKDRLVFGNAYYRLKMVDVDGQFKYSSVIPLKFNASVPLKVYPIPAVDHIMIEHPVSTGIEEIMILDNSGKPLGTGVLEAQKTITRVGLDVCRSGIYYLVYSAREKSQTVKFIVSE